jgi:hypothetical protein
MLSAKAYRKMNITAPARAFLIGTTWVNSVIMNTRTALTVALSLAVGICMTATSLAYGVNHPHTGATYGSSGDLSIGADFIKAGGGAGSFSMVRAWDNMIGPSALEEDLTGLTSRYGEVATDQFVSIFNFAIADAWKHAGTDNVSLPEPMENGGWPLALAVVRAGKAPDGQLSTGYLLGNVLSPRVYSQVAADINARYGSDADDQFRQVSNEFLNLVALQIGTIPTD